MSNDIKRLKTVKVLHCSAQHEHVKHTEMTQLTAQMFPRLRDSATDFLTNHG